MSSPVEAVLPFVATSVPTTPAKTASRSRSRSQVPEDWRMSENSDPNLPTPQKSIRSPPAKSVKEKKKSSGRTPAAVSTSAVLPPPPPAHGRKFIVARKKGDKGQGRQTDVKSRQQEAYELLRASQEGFFKKDGCGTLSYELEKKDMVRDGEGKTVDGDGCFTADEELCLQGLQGSTKVRKMRSIMLEKAMSSVPEAGSGRVMHLVKAFESLLTISKEKVEIQKTGEGRHKRMNWALPGMQQPPSVPLEETERGSTTASVSSSAEFFFPSKHFERDLLLYSSTESDTWRLSCNGRTSGGSRGSHRNSAEASRRSWNKKLRVTNQNPFKLKTEQRGRVKEERFHRKIKKMVMEEERLRVKIAQGIPWTTDEPECLVKPLVKEATEPIDLVLHSDVRAVERAEFDQYVAERMTLAQEIKLQRERLQKMEEEEEVRRLRKEMVPRAQPMPYFDRPFIPKKSGRLQTVPKEPKFHFRLKKTCESSACLRDILKNKAS